MLVFNVFDVFDASNASNASNAPNAPNPLNASNGNVGYGSIAASRWAPPPQRSFANDLPPSYDAHPPPPSYDSHLPVPVDPEAGSQGPALTERTPLIA